MTWSQGDFNGDGTVDINDLTIVLTNYGIAASARRASWPCRSRRIWSWSRHCCWLPFGELPVAEIDGPAHAHTRFTKDLLRLVFVELHGD